MDETGTLVLSRKLGEEVIVDGPCRVKVVRIQDGRVRLAITAAKSVRIDRAELREKRERESAVVSAA